MFSVLVRKNSCASIQLHWNTMSFSDWYKETTMTKRNSVMKKFLCWVSLIVQDKRSWRREWQNSVSDKIRLSTLLNIPRFFAHFLSVLHSAGSLFFPFSFWNREAVRVGQGQTGRAGWGWEGQRSELHNDGEPDTNLIATPEYLFPFKKSLTICDCGRWPADTLWPREFCPRHGHTHSHNTSHECVDGLTEGPTEGDCDRKARAEPTPLIGISNVKILYLALFCFFKSPLSDFFYRRRRSMARLVASCHFKESLFTKWRFHLLSWQFLAWHAFRKKTQQTLFFLQPRWVTFTYMSFSLFPNKHKNAAGPNMLKKEKEKTKPWPNLLSKNRPHSKTELNCRTVNLACTASKDFHELKQQCFKTQICILPWCFMGVAKEEYFFMTFVFLGDLGDRKVKGVVKS